MSKENGMNSNAKIYRFFDIAFSIIVLIVFSPIIALISIMIKLTDGGRIVFKQKRAGLHGKCFELYKFRTMYENNDIILKNHLEDNSKAKEEWEKFRKLKTYDPRVTPIGKFLRKTSLDEFPQFFNVLKGDMSVVGPRPYIMFEFEEYGVPYDVVNEILSVKPGITGLWQISSRNEATFDERIKQDLEYVKNKSLWLDLKIILKTVKVILTGKGAY